MDSGSGLESESIVGNMEQSRNLLVASLIGRKERERGCFFLFFGKLEEGKEEQVFLLFLFDDCFSIERPKDETGMISWRKEWNNDLGDSLVCNTCTDCSFIGPLGWS